MSSYDERPWLSSYDEGMPTEITSEHPNALDDIAFLPYTSGTTGPPKGSMNSHRHVVFNAQVYRDSMHLGPNDTVYGVAACSTSPD